MPAPTLHASGAAQSSVVVTVGTTAQNRERCNRDRRFRKHGKLDIPIAIAWTKQSLCGNKQCGMDQ